MSEPGDHALGGTRRGWLKGAAGTLVLSLAPLQLARGARLLDVRLWPAADYTRVTLELDAPLKSTHFMVRDTPPLRLVVDIEGIDLTPSLKELVGKVDAGDPYIRLVRIGQNRPRVVRLVIELKEDIKPQVFTLEPIGPYQHRLVMDLVPANPPDPLLALLREQPTRGGDTPRPQTPTGDTARPQPPTGDAARSPPTGDAARPQPRASDPARGDVARTESGIEPRTEPRIEPRAEPRAEPRTEPRIEPRTEPRTEPRLDMARTEPRDDVALEREIERSLGRTAERGRGSGRNVKRLVTVAIDPGHGGEDPGAVGKRGTLEKNVTLAIARRLERIIERDQRLSVLLTRDADYFVPLGQRVAKARRVQADLFVSIHADAWIRPDARGSSVFALSERGATSSAAAWMARRENEADQIGGINLGLHDAQLARVLLDLSTTAQINDSLKFGNAVLRELERINRLHKPRVEQAGFAVLKAPDIPSILVETAFISNPDEELRLRDDAYQQKMALAIYGGIRRYFQKYPPAARNPLG